MSDALLEEFEVSYFQFSIFQRLLPKQVLESIYPTELHSPYDP